MTNEERVILEKCGIHYEDDTLEKEIAIRVMTETRKQFKEYLEGRLDEATEKAYSSHTFDIGAIIEKGVYEKIINEFFGGE